MEVTTSPLRDITTRPVGDGIILYPQEHHEEDLVGESDFTMPLVQEFGIRIMRGSAAGWNGAMYERTFRDRLKGYRIKHALEIGTWRGVSSAILAHYADKVTTVDIRYYDEAPRVWMWAGVFDKMKYLVVPDNETKAAAIKDLDFDFAFIDGMHTYDDVAFDFELVKKCGRVLFHDYCDKCPGIVEFVDKLSEVTISEVTIAEPFAYWTDLWK